MGTRLGAHQLDEVVLLGIDVGTTFCKAAVVAPDGRELAHGRARTPWQPVRTGAEIAPDALVRVACEAAGEPAVLRCEVFVDDEPHPPGRRRSAVAERGRVGGPRTGRRGGGRTLAYISNGL